MSGKAEPVEPDDIIIEIWHSGFQKWDWYAYKASASLVRRSIVSDQAGQPIDGMYRHGRVRARWLAELEAKAAADKLHAPNTEPTSRTIIRAKQLRRVRDE